MLQLEDCCVGSLVGVVAVHATSPIVCMMNTIILCFMSDFYANIILLNLEKNR
jgi:hypothetical protein